MCWNNGRILIGTTRNFISDTYVTSELGPTTQVCERFLPIIRRRGSSFVLYPSVDGNGEEEGDSDDDDDAVSTLVKRFSRTG